MAERGDAQTSKYEAYLKSCGFTEEEIKQKIEERDVMYNLYYKNKQEAREITCASYERSVKAMTKDVCNFLGVKQCEK